MLNKSIRVKWFHSLRPFTWIWLVISVLVADCWYHSSTNLRFKTILFWNLNDVFFGRTEVWNTCHVVILGNLRPLQALYKLEMANWQPKWHGVIWFLALYKLVERFMNIHYFSKKPSRTCPLYNSLQSKNASILTDFDLFQNISYRSLSRSSKMRLILFLMSLVPIISARLFYNEVSSNKFYIKFCAKIFILIHFCEKVFLIHFEISLGLSEPTMWLAVSAHQVDQNANPP